MSGIGKQLRGSGLARIVNKSIKRKKFDTGGPVKPTQPIEPSSNTLEAYIKKLQQFGMSQKDIDRHLEKMYPNDTYPGNE
jgi:hypothetical protein